MENPEELEAWLFRLLHDAKTKLNMSDRTIAYILLREGTNYYFRDIMKDELRDSKEYT